jgi:histidine triad (HIT) family protein
MSAHADHCTFCDLIQGAAEVSVCHEDADAIAFMDIQPVNAGHVLVVPRAHYDSLLDVPAELGLHLFRITMRLANAIRKVTGNDDMNIVVNSGAAAGQDEPHYHVHIIPRRHGDGFEINLPFGGSAMPDRTILDAVAAQLIAAMRDPMKAESGGSHRDSASAKTVEMPVLPTADAIAAKTVEIPRAEIERMRAATVEIPAADLSRRRAGIIEREVVVKVAREGVSSGDPSRRGSWQVVEGAHGELIYDKHDDI